MVVRIIFVIYGIFKKPINKKAQWQAVTFGLSNGTRVLAVGMIFRTIWKINEIN